MTFRHTPSRERLITSQELALASGFLHVPIFNPDHPEFTNQNNVSSVISNDDNSVRQRKNLLLLSSQGGLLSRGEATTKNNSFFNPSTDTHNLNKLLD